MEEINEETNKNNSYVSTTVIFADEPNARYFYRKEKDLIYQYSMAPVKGSDPKYTYKHIEERLP
ncbi:hypothetical protein NST74_22040 [Paenibacillus sp. FSL F4-0125]|uniref:hypothetical protein n=1 Tax=Paenibacillus sp. FSL F4-0125 TaxID=2954730 RepID=UPI0030F9905C